MNRASRNFDGLARREADAGFAFSDEIGSGIQPRAVEQFNPDGGGFWGRRSGKLKLHKFRRIEVLSTVGVFHRHFCGRKSRQLAFDAVAFERAESYVRWRGKGG